MDGWEGTLRDLQQRKEASHGMEGRNPERPATKKGGQSLDGRERTLRDLQQRKEASHWMGGKEP